VTQKLPTLLLLIVGLSLLSASERAVGPFLPTSSLAPRAAAAGGTLTSTSPTTSPPNLIAAPSSLLAGSGGGVIAFVSDRSASQDIYVMNADGSDRRPLTTSPNQDGWPNWSPDGRQMAFQSDRSGAFNVYVMDTPGGSQADDSKARR